MHRLHRVLLVVLDLFLVSAVGIVVSAPVLQSRHDPHRPEAIPIVVSAQGFSQPNLSLPAGPYAFVVINRTGFHEITCYLERMPGDQIDGLATSQEFASIVLEKSRVVKNARLIAGEYRLRVESRPTWVMEIKVR